LIALDRGGRQGAIEYLSQLERELRTVMLLIGARDVAAARRSPKLITGELARWAELGR
jgi:isopentenyl-diphosphate delta-isomerase